MRDNKFEKFTSFSQSGNETWTLIFFPGWMDLNAHFPRAFRLYVPWPRHWCANGRRKFLWEYLQPPRGNLFPNPSSTSVASLTPSTDILPRAGNPTSHNSNIYGTADSPLATHPLQITIRPRENPQNPLCIVADILQQWRPNSRPTWVAFAFLRAKITLSQYCERWNRQFREATRTARNISSVEFLNLENMTINRSKQKTNKQENENRLIIDISNYIF